MKKWQKAKDEIHVREWNRILREKVYSPEEPDEYVVQFAGLLTEKKAVHVLDLDCGAGRHVIYFAKRGFEAYGVDFSETGLKMAKERLGREKRHASLVRCDMKKLPFVDSSFHAATCTRAIYHQKVARIQEALCEIGRVLRKNGLLLADFLSKSTCSYGKGVEVEENTFVEQGGVEKGVLHHFTDEKELKRLFKDFIIINLELRERVVEGKLRSRWIVTVMFQMDSKLGS